jgi:hypothetical protein
VPVSVAGVAERSTVSTRVKEFVGIAIVLAIVLAVEVVGLRSGKIGVAIVGLVAVLAVSVIAFRVELRWAGVAAACGAAFTLTWNGWFVGPVRPGDVLVLVALLCFVVVDPNGAFRTPPWWVKQLVFFLILGVLIQVYFPPDLGYLATRTVYNAGGHTSFSKLDNLALVNMGVAAKFIVAVAAIPAAFIGATRVDPRALRWLVISFASGTALSGWVAGADHFGADIGATLTGLPNVSVRTIGFSDHPNFLAAGIVIAVPFAFWLLFTGVRRDRLIGLWSLPGMMLGVYASGSRGGAVCVLVALALCVVAHPRTRTYTLNFAIGGVFLVGAVAVAVPSLGATILRATRLTSSPITEGSDRVRALAGTQGVADFKHAPFAGIGLQASTQASQVYLQELASGGIILFLAVNIYVLGGIVDSIRLMPTTTLAAMVAASLVTTLVLNLVETDLTDRFYYVPGAILIALLDLRRRRPDLPVLPRPVAVAA